MAVEIVFYSLAPKPAASGGKTYAAAASGKVSRGRKWYRLESRPCDVYQFPDGVTEWEVWDWLDKNPDAVRSRVAFTVNGAFHVMDNDAALSAVPGGRVARENAITLYEKGVDGWVVFVPEEKEGGDDNWRD